jgi:hypothetical protein
MTRGDAVMFIQTEATPNPATLKFLPGREVMHEGTADFRDAEGARAASPLAGGLFAIPGITGVFFGYDFITVTSDGRTEWQHLKPAILGTIMEHFMSGQPVMTSTREEQQAGETAEFYDQADSEIVVTIKELLDTRGGYQNGTVYLYMKGACAGCPSSTATLKHGIQNLLRHFVPEVEHVEQVAA